MSIQDQLFDGVAPLFEEFAASIGPVIMSLAAIGETARQATYPDDFDPGPD